MSTQSQQSDRSRIAWPVAHLLALAPLDVWVRMLIKSGGVKPRYWVRLGFVLVTSLAGTVCTVHERVILSVVFWVQNQKRKRRAGSPSHQDIGIEHKPGAVVIVGYYRSGTTHLHNLMSCDRRFVTPRWYQCLAGQGFVLGWSLIRFILVPFLGTTRPQDAVGFGPSWPAEDDFALCTSGLCSSIPGRFIFPSQWETWKRWHGLDGLNDKELNRWRSLTAMFVWKLTRGKNKARIILLKTPSHTARIAELDRLFKGNIKFVHLVREPSAVIDSNVRLHDSLKDHLLEDAPDVQAVRDRIVEEYEYTEAKCGDESQTIDPSRFVRIRYQDLRADGISTLEGIYQSLDLQWNEQSKSDAEHYLSQLGSYTSPKAAIDLGTPSEHEQAICARMTEHYKLDEPTTDTALITPASPLVLRFLSGIIAAIMLAIGCTLAWVGIVWMLHTYDPSIRMRLIPLVWIAGAVIGLGIRKAARAGSLKLGLLAATLTVLVVLMAAFPVTVINWNWAANDGRQAWIYHNAKGGLEGLKGIASLVFIALGAITAYRHASSVGPTIPGRSIPGR